MKFFIFILTVMLVLEVSTATTNANETKTIFLVLDNSGSMKKNDPGFLMKKTVVDFIKSQNEQTTIGIVAFDTNGKLLQEVTPLNSDANREKCIRSLDKINYGGAYTNITSAIEIATYELNRLEGDSIFKAIILVTDGYIDTGDKNLDIQKRNLLIETQSKAAKEAGIKIFGVAFTENADFELMQAISITTGGNYFRAFKSEDLNTIFNKLNEKIIEKVQESAPVEIVKTVEVEKDSAFKSEYILGLILVIIVLSISVYILIRKSKRNKKTSESGMLIPPAYLIDNEKKFNTKEFRIENEVTSIGRVKDNDLYLKEEDRTVSSFNHAQIIYRDNKFYIKDSSSNFTKVNGEKLEKDKEFQLFDGDEIQIVKHSLTFKYDDKYNNSTEFFDSDEKTVFLSGEDIDDIQESKQEEEARLKKQQEEKQKQEEEARLKKQQEEKQKQEEEARLKKQQEEKQKQEEEARLKKQREEKHKQEEEARLKKQQEEKQKQEEEARLKKQQEEKQKQEEEARLKKQQEEKQKQEEEARLKKQQEEKQKQEEEARLKKQREEKQKQEEEARLKKQQEEKQKQEEEARLKKQQEEKQKQEEEARLKKQQEEKQKQEEEARLKIDVDPQVDITENLGDSTTGLSPTEFQILCKNHNDRQATEYCGECGGMFCEECVRITEEGNTICNDCNAKQD